MIYTINKEKLVHLLQGRLPGESAQQKMAPEVRMGIEKSDNCRQAAVLILLFPEGKSIHTVFMKRNVYDGPHSGQISFPGGMHEEPDRDLMATALRETEEETGIKSAVIEILGKLSLLYIPVSNFCVTPFVGWLSGRPNFLPDASEVQYLITPALEELMDSRNRHTKSLQRHGYDIVTPYIQIDEDIIWGATAMILSEFTELISR